MLRRCRPLQGAGRETANIPENGRPRGKKPSRPACEPRLLGGSRPRQSRGSGRTVVRRHRGTMPARQLHRLDAEPQARRRPGPGRVHGAVVRARHGNRGPVRPLGRGADLFVGTPGAHHSPRRERPPHRLRRTSVNEKAHGHPVGSRRGLPDRREFIISGSARNWSLNLAPTCGITDEAGTPAGEVSGRVPPAQGGLGRIPHYGPDL